MTDRLNVPEAVHGIINALNLAGYEAYIVGGCVRDGLMGRKPKDWDLTTSARPEEVKRIFPHTFDTGIQHGTVTVRMNAESYEVTTYRVDGDYTDHRRPDEVTFTASLKEDLMRRDFTVNAMAYHPKTGLVDYYHGREDLANGIIRAVGSPAERFREDALRMLRAIRFSAQLDFAIEENTWQGIRSMAPLIRYVSAERIRDELTKTLISDHPEAMEKVYASGLMHEILPEWEACMTTPQHTPYHMYSVGVHILETLQHIEADPVLRWTMFLHDIGKPYAHTNTPDGTPYGRDHFIGHVEMGAEMAGRILRQLKFDNHSRARIVRLITFHEARYSSKPYHMRKLISDVGRENFPDLLRVLRADAWGKSEAWRVESLNEIDCMEQFFLEMSERGEAVSIAELAIDGKDLIAIGYPRGPEIGRVLDLLLDAVLKNPELNHKDLLLQTAEGLKDAVCRKET